MNNPPSLLQPQSQKMPVLASVSGSTAGSLPKSVRQRAGHDFKIYLQNELLRRCEIDPKYSLRKLAKTLDTDASAFAKILKGKRPLGKNLIRRFGEKLDLAPDEILEFIGHQERQRHQKPLPSPAVPPTQGPVDANYQKLTIDSFRMISDWYHYALLEIMRLDHFERDSKWIAKVLGVTPLEIDLAIERLVRLGVLEITPTGEWIDHSGGKSTNISQPFYDGAHRKLQKQILEKAITAIETTPVARRDQSSMTMAVDVNLLQEAKAMIKNFRRELARFLSRGDKRNQVYHLSVSLYPVTTITDRVEEDASEEDERI